MRRCQACGTSLEGRSPRARYCSSTCRGRGHRGAAPLVPLPAPNEAAAAPDPDAPLPTLEEVAAELAAQLRSPHCPPTAKAALAREYRATLAEIEKSRPKAKDGIDEIAERRARRGAG